MPRPTLTNRLAAEAFGTFALVFAGTGAIVADAGGGGLGTLGVALAFGLVVMVMIHAVGDVSGAHLNPAVTLGFFRAGRLEGGLVAPYVAAQLAGALAASGLLAALVPGATELAHLGATRPSIPLPAAFLLEVLLTWVLMVVILRVSSGARETGIMAGAAVGGTIALAALFAGPLSGASMNPARSLAPAVFSGTLAELWIYLLAPPVGALLAVPTCRAFGCDEGACCSPKESSGKGSRARTPGLSA